MSVDSPEPRQRTVAELLAANGGSQTGRRRRRRASEDDAPAGGPPPGPGRVAPEAQAGPATARRPATANGWVGDGPAPSAPAEHPSFPSRRPEPAEGPGDPRGAPPNGYGPQAFAPNGRPGPAGPPANGYVNGAGGGARRPDDGYGPPPQARPDRPGPQSPQSPQSPQPESRPYGTDGPYGAGGADEIPTSRLGARRPAEDLDGGPPTQFGAPLLDDDEPATQTQGRPVPADAGPPTGTYDPFVDDDEDDGEWSPAGGRTAVLAPGRPDLDEHSGHGGPESGPVEEDDEAGDRSGRGADDAEPPAGLDDAASAGAAGTGQAWAVVIAQWIGGAVAGAAIWVLFRFLWFSFPIVALAMAVVLTVGLVLGVRALLRNDDLKTTLFAVLVGLLLTVSPAILVLLDR